MVSGDCGAVGRNASMQKTVAVLNDGKENAGNFLPIITAALTTVLEVTHLFQSATNAVSITEGWKLYCNCKIEIFKIFYELILSVWQRLRTAGDDIILYCPNVWYITVFGVILRISSFSRIIPACFNCTLNISQTYKRYLILLQEPHNYQPT